MKKSMFQICCFQTERFKSHYNDAWGDISFITKTMSQMSVIARVYLMIES